MTEPDEDQVQALGAAICSHRHSHAMNGTSPVPCGAAESEARYHLRWLAWDHHGGWVLRRIVE